MPFSVITVTRLVSSVNTVDGTTKAIETYLSSTKITPLLASAIALAHSANDVSNARTFVSSRFRSRAIIGLGCI